MSRAVRCSYCRGVAPVDTMAPPLEVLGTVYRCCAGYCDKTFRQLYVAELQLTIAAGAGGRGKGNVCVTVASARRGTAGGDPAALPTPAAASHTAHIGTSGLNFSPRRPAFRRVEYCPKNRPHENSAPETNCPCCAGLGVAARCEACAGTGVWLVRSDRSAHILQIPAIERCQYCAGRGYIPISKERAEALGFSGWRTGMG